MGTDKIALPTLWKLGVIEGVCMRPSSICIRDVRVIRGSFSSNKLAPCEEFDRLNYDRLKRKQHRQVTVLFGETNRMVIAR